MGCRIIEMHRLAVLSDVDREASTCSEAKGLEADSSDMHASRHMATVLSKQSLSILLELQSSEGQIEGPSRITKGVRGFRLV